MEFLFLLGPGHLGSRAERVAEQHGAELVNYTEPDGRKRHWFRAPNRGEPWDRQLRSDVQVALQEAGVLE